MVDWENTGKMHKKESNPLVLIQGFSFKGENISLLFST